MRISIISFTGRGTALSKKIKQVLKDDFECMLYTKYSQNTDSNIQEISGPTADWAAQRFLEQDGLLFIGACGIAVRSIAPCIKDKLQDSPVLVMDETGAYVIPILSGHYGGANELAGLIADRMQAQAVITTATDVNHLFAVDVFAAKNHLVIKEREKIAQVSAKILDTKEITMAVAGEAAGNVPPEVKLVSYPPKQAVDVLVAASSQKEGKEAASSVEMHLIPRVLVLGMGCRRGKSSEEIEAFVTAELKERRIPIEAVAVLATIERKKDEEGLLSFAQKYGMEFAYFTGEQLEAAEGSFTGSGFVKEQVGVDNVCERAAVTAAGTGGRLLVRKTAGNGMTLAVAEKRWMVSFDKREVYDEA